MTWGSVWTPRLVALLAAIVVCLQTLKPDAVTPLGSDEQVSVYIACGSTPKTVMERALTQSATPPASFWLNAWSLQVGDSLHVGTREFWFRLPSVIALLGALAAVYWIASGCSDAWAGATAALLLAFHPTAIKELGQQARPYALGQFAALLAVGSLLRLRSEGWRPRHAATFVIGNALLPWTHYLFVVLWPLEVLLLALPSVWKPEPGRKRMNAGVVLLLLCISAAPTFLLLPGILRLQLIGPSLEWITRTPELVEVSSLIGWTPVLWLAAAAMFAFVVTPFTGWTKGRTGLALLLWAVVPALLLRGASLALHQPSLAQTRYLLPQIGAAVLFTTWGLRSLAPRRLAFVPAIVAAGIGLANLYGGGFWHILLYPVRHDSCWKDAATLIAEKGSPRDLVFTSTGLVESRLVPMSHRDEGFQEYTSSRLSRFYLPTPAVRRALPFVWKEDPQAEWLKDYTARARSTLDGGGAVWFVFSSDTDVGLAVQNAADRWVKSMGLKWELLNKEKVARVFRVVH